LSGGLEHLKIETRLRGGRVERRSGQKKIPECFLRKEIPVKKRVLGNFKIVFGFQNFDTVTKVR
jgi:hypothetical protein